jgi:hypothetical protein
MLSTHTAQDVMLYTKTRGKYLNASQQYRSHFLAHFRGILLAEGIEPAVESVAMVAQQAMEDSMATRSWMLYGRSEVSQPPPRLRCLRVVSDE